MAEISVAKVSDTKAIEAVYELSVVQPIRKERFTIKRLDMEIAMLQKEMDALIAKKNAALKLEEK